MSRLEDFIQNNREDFDKFEPGPVIWHNIQQKLKKPASPKVIHISMRTLRWSAAAAVILMLGAGAYYFFSGKKAETQPQIARKTTQPANNNLPVVTPHDSVREVHSNQPAIGDATDQQLAKNEDAAYNEELYHYTRLVELKQNQVRKIKKDEPLLYQQFAGDFNKLDSSFHTLRKQLPANPNKEQILEAMILNLQYQEALLNQQLNIIKKINNTKKQAYEKAYRSA